MPLKKDFIHVDFFLISVKLLIRTIPSSNRIRTLQYGIRGTAIYNWFKYYLTNQPKFVSIGNTLSDTKQVLMGVPLGSVLRPLLFLLYINDFSNSLSAFAFNLFADDFLCMATLFHSDTVTL